MTPEDVSRTGRRKETDRRRHLIELATLSGNGADPLANAQAAENFVNALPSDNSLAVQRALCDALARIGARCGPDQDQLRALAMMDRKSRRLRYELMSDYLATVAGSPERERELRHAIFELSRSFARGYEIFLRHARVRSMLPAWRRHVPAIVVALFGHREVELLLSLFRYEVWPRGRWRELLAAYRFVQTAGLAAEVVTIARPEGEPALTITPERALIRLLLLQRVDSGQFVPGEAAIARQRIAGWSELVKLAAPAPDEQIEKAAEGFVVDLRSSEGLRRPASAMARTGDYRTLDTSPIVDAIDHELAALRAALAENDVGAVVKARRLALLSKLRIVLAAQAVQVKRRGERTEVALMSVQVMVGGLPNISRMLRNEARVRAALPDRQLGFQEITLADVPDTSRGRLASIDATSGDTLAPFPSTASFGVPQDCWQVLDRSESGCRLRGRVSTTQRVVPGTLLACRETEDAAWALVVVRRLRTIVGNNVELGVEYIGCRPQRVLLCGEVLVDSGDPASPEAKAQRSIALFLPESKEYPRIPIRTLIVPVREYRNGRVLTMLSTTSEVSIRLKEPIEHQREFVWASYELADPSRAAG